MLLSFFPFFYRCDPFELRVKVDQAGVSEDTLRLLSRLFLVNDRPMYVHFRTIAGQSF